MPRYPLGKRVCGAVVVIAMVCGAVVVVATRIIYLARSTRP